MGLGKTFVGSEKMKQLGAKVNLVVCQKSKIDDWVEHLIDNYTDKVLCKEFPWTVYDLTKKKDFEQFMFCVTENIDVIGVINYELAFRRKELRKLNDFTLMLDESSMIQNEKAKRSKFILNLNPKNVILLSGTPTSGKYERLWSQIRLLGWNIGKSTFWNQFIITKNLEIQGMPFPIKKVVGYKNVERLKNKLHDYGAVFMKTDEVFDLPNQIDQKIKVNTSKEYRKFKKDCIIGWDEEFPPGNDIRHIELVGDTTLTKMLYERQLCGHYSKEKLNAFRDLLESTSDRLIVFYNFTEEERLLHKIAEVDYGRPCSIISGKHKSLMAYERADDSITFVQYQAGAMGLNLQKANKIVYYSPPLSAELFMQSKKRTHRIGQERTCFYYYMTCTKSIEEKIYKALEKGIDYTEALFEKEN